MRLTQKHGETKTTKRKNGKMSSKKYDSSKIRVNPVFSYIDENENNWKQFLQWLANNKFQGRFSPEFTQLMVYYSGRGRHEFAIEPNAELLRFLVFKDEGIAALREDMKKKLSKKNNSELSATEKARLELFAKETREKQRRRADNQFSKEFFFEGKDYPDVVVITNSIVLIIEGKLTEPHLTTHTTWLNGRDQMIRHLDSAIACKVVKGHPFFEHDIFGMYVVGNGIDVDGHLTEGCDKSIELSGRHPHYNMENYTYLGHEWYWRKALPQYAGNEAKMKAIAKCFLGYVTWNEIGRLFDGIKAPQDTVNQNTTTLR